MKREEIEENDLPQMESLYKIFAAGAAKTLLEQESGRCKIYDVAWFREQPHWVIDRWWTKQERIAAGVDESPSAADKTEVDRCVQEFNDAVADYDQFVFADLLSEIPCTEVVLGDESLFKTFIGTRVLRRDLSNDESKIPLYSANAIQPMGFVEQSNISDFSYPSILWGIDNSLFNYKLIPAGQVFATTDHCGTVQIIHPLIIPEYLLYALCLLRSDRSFDRAFRSSLSNMSLLSVAIPIPQDGTFDIETQQVVARRFTAMQEKQQQLRVAKAKLDEVFSRYLVMGNWH